jgi:Uma2 family endonuclease
MSVEETNEALTPRRWTARELELLGKLGILGEEERVELLGGMIVPMTPPGSFHVDLVSRLNHALVKAAGEDVWVSPQNPLACGEDRPQPDLAVVPRERLHREALPDFALLVVEVSDSSLRRDRLKAGVYARAGIPQLWLVDVQARAVEVHTEPDAEVGRYRSLRVLRGQDALTSPALPQLRLAVDDVFGSSH